MKKQNPETKKVKQVSQDEKMAILSKADEVKGEQLSLMPDGKIFITNEIKELLSGNISVDDPEKKYDLYYKGIERLLRKHLPKGKQFAKARSYIREEKSVYLTRGKRLNEQGRRNADSRMGYISDAQEILKIITSWIMKSATMAELYNELRDLNAEKGYGTRVNY